MPRFAYSAYAEDGSTIRGEIDATDDMLVLDQLARKGLIPISIEEGGSTEPWWNRDLSLSPGGAQLKNSELQGFFATFGAMLQSSFPVSRSLRFVEEQSRGKATRQLAARIREAVEGGSSLSDAIKDHGASIPKRFRTMIALGEASNRLPESVKRASEILAVEDRLQRDLRQALIYPVILLFMSALVLSIVVFYLAPTLAPVFGSANAETPPVLRVMIVFRDLIVSFWPTLIAAAAVLVVLFIAFRKRIYEVGFDMASRMPVIGSYLNKRESLRLAQTLSLLLSSGARLTAAVETAQGVSTLLKWRELLDKAHKKMIDGGTLGTTLKNSKLVDPFLKSMVEAGEESDRLPELLEAATQTLTMQTAEALNRAIRLTTPILTLTIGIGVGAIILSTITAIMDLNDIAL